MNEQNIMQVILSLYPDDVDKREGSILWDYYYPRAIDLAHRVPGITPERVAQVFKKDEAILHLAKMPSYY